MRLSSTLPWILVACAIATALVAAVGYTVATLYRAPDHISLGSSPSCPTDEVDLGIQEVLKSPIQKEQAIKILLWAETSNSVDRVPPSTTSNILRWQRQQNLLKSMSGQKLAGLLCQGPVVSVGGKRLAGVASVAIEHLGKPIEQVTRKEAFLIACAVIGADPEARNLLRMPSATIVDDLVELCPRFDEA